MEKNNVRDLNLSRYFEEISSTEKFVLSSMNTIKYRSYCFEKYINVDEENLSNNEINQFFQCFQNLKDLHIQWQAETDKFSK